MLPLNVMEILIICIHLKQLSKRDVSKMPVNMYLKTAL